MKIIAYSGSPRKSGNTQLVIKKVLEGAFKDGTAPDIVNINELNIKGCQACYYCKKNDNKCIIKDDMQEQHKNILESDVIILASPVYAWQISAQSKLFLDRLYNFYNLNAPSRIKGKKLILLFTHASQESSLYTPYFEYLKNSLTFMGFDILETLVVPGVRIPGEVENNEEIMKKAYEIGEKLVSNYYA